MICLLDEQRTITDKGGTMRLGASRPRSIRRSRAAACYGRERFPSAIGTVTSSTTSTGSSSRPMACRRGHEPGRRAGGDYRVADHPWFVAVQFHPEFKCKPTQAHPLFAGFIGAAVEAHAHALGTSARVGSLLIRPLAA